MSPEIQALVDKLNAAITGMLGRIVGGSSAKDLADLKAGVQATIDSLDATNGTNPNNP